MANVGFCVLYEGQAPITHDIVFVHGLQGDRVKTWSKDKLCWPRDLLKEDLPNARVLSWGYDASIVRFFEASGQESIADHAWQLLADLARRRRKAEEKQRPIIFVCHSLGGLIVKDALSQSHAESTYQPIVKPNLANTKLKTIGVVFAGTPHQGSDKAKWGRVAANLAAFVYKDNSSVQVTALQRGSETLERLRTDFARICGTVRIYTFREEHKWSEAVGKIVDNDSATLGVWHEQFESLPGSHSDMIKFSSREETGYERLSGSIGDIIEAGPMVNIRITHYGIAIRAYHGEDHLHLTFTEHTRISNIRFVHRSEWMGTCNGHTGLFPKDFVELHDDDIARPESVSIAPVPTRTPTWKKVPPPVPEKPSTTVAAKTTKMVDDDGIRVIPSSDPVNDISDALRGSKIATSDPRRTDPQYQDWLEAFWICCEEGQLKGVEKQVKRGVDVNTVARSGDCIAQYGTALVAAVSNGHIEVTRYLLENGARPNQPGNAQGISLPLHIAASLANKTMVKLLLKHGARCDVQGGAYRFPLTAAAVGGDVSIMRLLIQHGAILKACDYEGETAMHGAVIGGHLEAVKWLVSQGLDHNIRGDQGTALELAIAKNKEQPGFAADIVTYLSGGKIQPLRAPRAGTTTTQKTTVNIFTEVIEEEEEEEEIDPVAARFFGNILQASLMMAAEEGNVEDVKKLLLPPLPVDPNKPFDDGGEYGYPLHAAARNGHTVAVALLLEHGADVNAQGFRLGTALHFAAFEGNLLTAALLIAFGANVNAISNVSSGLQATPLEVAAANGQVKCVQYLLEQGADVNLTGGTCGSALHAAASADSSSFAVTKILLDHNANVQTVDSDRLTAADIAHGNDRPQTELLLRQHGCRRAPVLSFRRLATWSNRVDVQTGKRETMEQEQRMQNLMDFYAAQMAALSR